MFQTKVVKKIGTHILCAVSRPVPPPLFFGGWDNVDKCFRVGQATDDSMTYAHCVLFA